MASRKSSLPELLAPAGSMEKLVTALAYGADAVYVSGRGLHLRAGAAGMDDDELLRARRATREAGARLYYCLNAYPRESDLAALEKRLEFLAGLSPDAVIAADPGVARRVVSDLPGLRLHVSTQANVTSSLAASFWREMGACRVNLARELSADEIEAVSRALADLETEVFVHGAMCLSVSGRCLLSDWLNARSANRGLCTQPCRFEYRPTAVRLEEETRPGRDTWEIVEGEGHSAFLAADDLCLAAHLPRLSATGAASLKIEGRARSASYIAQVTDAYRTALDDLAKGEFAAEKYLDRLRRATLRPLSSGFFLDSGRRQQYEPLEPKLRPVARIGERLGEAAWRVAAKAELAGGAKLCALLPSMRTRCLAPSEWALESESGEPVTRLGAGQSGVLRAECADLAPGIFLALKQERKV